MLNTICRLFHTQGFNNTGINQIVKEADVAKSVLYQHFESKEDIAIGFLNARHLTWFEKLSMNVLRGKSVKGKLIAAFDFLIVMNREEGFRGCAFLNILSEIAPENTRIRDLIQAHKEDLRSFFCELTAETDLNADMIYLLFEGAITESKLFRNDWPVECCKSIINSLI